MDIAKNNITKELESTLASGATTLVLKAGHGSAFPRAFSGTVESGSSVTILNSIGILAKTIAVGQYIVNLSDGKGTGDEKTFAWATVLSVATDSISTTKLTGGANNTWNTNDIWAVNSFTVTVNKRFEDDIDKKVIAQEIIRIKDTERVNNLPVADTLICELGDRGFASTTPATWTTPNIFVDLFVPSSGWNQMREAVKDLKKDKVEVIETGRDLDWTQANIEIAIPTQNNNPVTKGYVDSAILAGSAISLPAGEVIISTEPKALCLNSSLGSEVIKEQELTGNQDATPSSASSNISFTVTNPKILTKFAIEVIQNVSPQTLIYTFRIHKQVISKTSGQPEIPIVYEEEDIAVGQSTSGTRTFVEVIISDPFLLHVNHKYTIIMNFTVASGSFFGFGQGAPTDNFKLWGKDVNYEGKLIKADMSNIYKRNFVGFSLKDTNVQVDDDLLHKRTDVVEFDNPSFVVGQHYYLDTAGNITATINSDKEILAGLAISTNKLLLKIDSDDYFDDKILI